MSKELRSKLIRLAHKNPELRKDLLPLIQKSALRRYSNNPFDPYCVKPIVVPDRAMDWLRTAYQIVISSLMGLGEDFDFSTPRPKFEGKENMKLSFNWEGNDFIIGVDPSRYILYFSSPKKRYAITKDWNRTTPEILAKDIIKYISSM